MLLNENIIPITYMPGTGGSFLCHFIISARENDKKLVLLSHYGNAHSHGLRDITTKGLHVPYTDSDVINSLSTQQYDSTIKKTYYTPVHIFDIKVVKDNFKKAIRITYDIDDVEEISIVFYGKHARLYPKESSINDIKANTIKCLPLFQREDNISNMLFISWKEMFKGNIDNLITKLSIFTNIISDNFVKESIIHWRNKTQHCIDTFK